MKKQYSRLLALILCLSFVCSLVPAMATAEEDLMRFQVENGEATLINAGWEISGDVVIPSTYEGYPVTAIAAYAFSEECYIQSVTIPHTVTSIHREAFMCTELEAFYVDKNNPVYSADSRGVLYNKDQTVLVRAPLKLSGSYTVPDGVATIEEYAFYLSFNLTEVILPEGLAHIGQRAFAACNKLSTPCLPESVFDISLYAFSGCSQFNYNTFDNANYLGTAENPYHVLVEVTDESITSAQAHPNTKVIAGAAFRHCNALTQITIPEGVCSLGIWSFNGCSALTQLQLPSTLVFIGANAFEESGLTQITVPEGVGSIETKTFWDCTDLRTVVLPESITSIGEMAFAGTALTEITLGKNVAQIEDSAFYGCSAMTAIRVDEANPNYTGDNQGVLYNKAKTALLYAPTAISGSYQIPQTVNRIESYAFYGCRDLTELTLPQSLTFLGEYALACSGLNTVTIPNGITELATGLLYNSDITTVSLPQGLTKIDTEAFYSCDLLQDIQIPNSVTTIGNSAFRDCYTLQTVNFPEGVELIDDYAFSGCSGLIKVSIPNSIRQVGTQAFGSCRELMYGYSLGAPGRYLGNEETPCLVLMGVSDDEVSRITVDKDTKVIADSALASCCELSSLTLPEGLVTIGDYSLYCCESLRSLTIPSTVTYIGEYSFEKGRLTEIIIPASVQKIGDYAFRNCQKLSTLRFCGTLPIMGSDTFDSVTATAYCHSKGNESRMKNYGGDLTWVEGHVFLNYLPDQGFSCTAGGKMTAKCEGCAVTNTVTVTQTAEHIFEMGECTVCGASDPNNCILTGTVTGSDDSDTTFTLLQNGEVVKNLTVNGNTYLWEQLQSGDYTLTVTKENHVTYTAPITVKAGKNSLDLTLCRPGDVVGIGTLNIGDVSRIYSHIRGTSPLTGYALACADVNGNGTVNMGDIAKLYSKVRGD